MTNRLQDNKIAGRYAKALFEAALDSGKLDEVKADLETIQKLMAELPSLNTFFINPAIPVADKVAFVTKELAPKLSSWVGNLLKLMVDNNRLSSFPALIERFQALLDTHQNIATAEVITAVELDAALQERFAKGLEKRFGFKQVKLKNRVEPGVLGGAIVKIQDQVIDGSYSGRLEALKKQLV